MRPTSVCLVRGPSGKPGLLNHIIREVATNRILKTLYVWTDIVGRNHDALVVPVVLEPLPLFVCMI
jgi:hypothetical protein